MLRMTTGELTPGMRLAKTILAEDGRVLLFAGTQLKESYIKTLQEMGVHAVYVTNELAPDVQPADLVSDQTVQALAAGMKETMTELSRLFHSSARGGLRKFSGGLLSARVKSAVDLMVSELVANRRAVINLQDLRATDEAAVGHSINTCILATLMGLALNYNMNQLHELGMGGLMHDLGKALLPRELIHRKGFWSPTELELVKQHTTLGWEVLSKQPEIKFTSAAVALQHHERFLGGGYPRGIAGKEIHEYARIVAIVDTYDSMVTDRPGRRGFSPNRAIQVMNGLMAGWFDPDLLKVFAECAAPYPVGSMVQISGGYTAVVVAVERGKIAQPRIRILKDPSGAPLPRPVELDLAARPEIQIERPVHDRTPADFRPEGLS